MDKESLTPEQSLAIISSIIQKAKSKFEEDGKIYVMWGIILIIASATQYYLLNNGYAEINHYPYFLTPIGAIISFWYYRKKALDEETKDNKSPLGKINSILWILVSINILVISFAFNSSLASNLVPIILIILGIGLGVSGGVIHSRLLLFSGIVVNIAGYLGFFISPIHHPLITLGVSLFAILIPGVVLMNNHKKKDV